MDNDSVDETLNSITAPRSANLTMSESIVIRIIVLLGTAESVARRVTMPAAPVTGGELTSVARPLVLELSIPL